MLPSIQDECPPSPTAAVSSTARSGDPNESRPSSRFVKRPLSWPKESAQEPLLERLGGKPAVKTLMDNLFRHIGSTDSLAPIFAKNHVPMAVLKMHHAQLFLVLLGPSNERPCLDAMVDFLLETHVRIFRDWGLNETHFDALMKCFVQAMNDVQMSSDHQVECLGLIAPLRIVFVYGAAVAREEASFPTDEASKKVPLASAETMKSSGQTQELRLPDGHLPKTPAWLGDFLGGQEQLREWTNKLHHRWAFEDAELAPWFSHLPYHSMEAYCQNFLMLIFSAYADTTTTDDSAPLQSIFPDKEKFNESVTSLLYTKDPEDGYYIEWKRQLRNIRFPHGLKRADCQLTRAQFDSMVDHVYEIGSDFQAAGSFWLPPDEFEEVLQISRARRSMCVDEDSSGNMEFRRKEQHHRLWQDPALKTSTENEEWWAPTPPSVVSRTSEASSQAPPSPTPTRKSEKSFDRMSVGSGSSSHGNSFNSQSRSSSRSNYRKHRHAVSKARENQQLQIPVA